MDKRRKKDIMFLSIITIIIGIASFMLLSPIIKNRVIDRNKTMNVIEQFEKELKNENSSKPSHEIDLNKSKENNNKVIGIIYIPKINIILPIYNNSGEYAISNGAGILQTYGHPTGKVGTHSVITSHAGLKNGLFTDLYRLDENDVFFIKDENGQMSKYVITEQNVVLPDDFSKLQPEKDKCLVTLLTCTPIGINTHRLLQKGEKGIFDMDEFLNMKNPFFISKYEAIMIGITLILWIIDIYLFVKLKRSNSKDEK